jgi:energy-coupling factor transporter ATP-binding protein EcfA2
MAINLKTTASLASNNAKILVYGQAGAGKTTLAATLPAPIILSAEGGLLSIQDANLPYIEVTSMATLMEAYRWLRDSHEAKDYQSVALDSISEIAEVVLNVEKKLNKDPRAAYGAMQEQMADIVRAFRDLAGRHVYMSAKLEKTQDEMGRVLYSPSMPGNKFGQSLPYFFDQVLALRVEKDAEGISQRALMCDSDGLWQAKDRSGKLGPWEAPDLGQIIAKIGGAK